MVPPNLLKHFKYWLGTSLKTELHSSKIILGFYGNIMLFQYEMNGRGDCYEDIAVRTIFFYMMTLSPKCLNIS